VVPVAHLLPSAVNDRRHGRPYPCSGVAGRSLCGSRHESRTAMPGQSCGCRSHRACTNLRTHAVRREDGIAASSRPTSSWPVLSCSGVSEGTAVRTHTRGRVARSGPRIWPPGVDGGYEAHRRGDNTALLLAVSVPASRASRLPQATRTNQYLEN
jgi:hypothetical protein